MHIINVETLMLEEFPRRPPGDYAILSHTWNSVASNEVLFSDIKPNGLSGCPDKPGKRKVVGCCKQAKVEGFKYVWIDSCCIDKSNAVELGEAINSMYRWYRDSAVCYAYMEDVPNEDNILDPGAAFSQSRWFTRGWTLQEMLAPPELHFYDTSWGIIAAKQDIIHELETITGIPRQSLLRFDPNTTEATVAQRMSWAARRTTTRDEDTSYSLLGLFDVNLPMIYGEGGRNAFVRLQQAILEKTRDNSIFAWGLTNGAMSKSGQSTLPKERSNSGSSTDCILSDGIWASSPADFSRCGKVVTRKPVGGTVFSFSSGRLQIDLTPVAITKTTASLPDGTSIPGSGTATSLSAPSAREVHYGLLNCGPDQETEASSTVVGIPLYIVTKEKDSTYAPVEYIRPKGYAPVYLTRPVLENGASWPLHSISIRVEMDAGSRSTSRQSWYSLRYPRKSLALVETYPPSEWRGSAARMPDADDVDFPEPHKKKWFIAHFRPVGGENGDPKSARGFLFVVCVQLSEDGAQLAMEAGLMTMSETVVVAKIAEKLPYMRNAIYNHRRATVNGVVMTATIEYEAETFTIVPATATLSGEDLDADTEIQHAEKKLSLPEMFSFLDDASSESRRQRSAVRSHSNLLAMRMEQLAKIEDDLKKLEEERQNMIATIMPLQKTVASMNERIHDLDDRFQGTARTVDRYITGICAAEAPRVQDDWLGELLLTRHGDIESCSVCRVHYRSEATETEKVSGTDSVSRVTDLVRSKLSNSSSMMALFCAVAHGHIRETELLLPAIASPDWQIERQLRPFITMSAFDGNRTMAEALVNGGKTNIDTRDEATGETPLWVALQRGHYHTAQFLVEAGADVFAKNSSGGSLINWAAGAGSYSCVNFLLQQHGADVNTEWFDVQKAPLVAAAYNGNQDVIQLLLERTVAMTDPRDMKQFALVVQAALEAAVTAGHTEAVRVFLANKNCVWSITPIFLMAINQKRLKILEALLDRTATQPQNWENLDAGDVMMVAVMQQPPDCLAVLLKYHFPVNVSAAKNGLTPLTTAATFGRHLAADMLIMGGAQVDLKSPNELRTPLYMAIKGGHTQTVRVLLARGADPTAPVGLRGSPLKKAKQMGDKTILDLVENAQRGIRPELPMAQLRGMNVRDYIDAGKPDPSQNLRLVRRKVTAD